MRQRLMYLAYYLGPSVGVRIYSGKRTKKQQYQRLVRGDTTIFASKHLDGAAADLILSVNGLDAPRSLYTTAGAIWTELGGIWGGNFRDPALAAAEYQHFEE